MYKLEIIHKGEKKRIGVLAKGKRSDAKKYIESWGPTLKAQLKRMAKYGKIETGDLFHHLRDKIYEFKPKNARLYCFFHNDIVICTHGANKTKKKREDLEIKKAIRMRKEFCRQIND
ncbi:MAG: type II toxin-antitoxin system RelE/ParE family toxin [bacterium]